MKLIGVFVLGVTLIGFTLIGICQAKGEFLFSSIEQDLSILKGCLKYFQILWGSTTLSAAQSVAIAKPIQPKPSVSKQQSPHLPHKCKSKCKQRLTFAVANRIEIERPKMNKWISWGNNNDIHNEELSKSVDYVCIRSFAWILFALTPTPTCSHTQIETETETRSLNRLISRNTYEYKMKVSCKNILFQFYWHKANPSNM